MQTNPRVFTNPLVDRLTELPMIRAVPAGQPTRSQIKCFRNAIETAIYSRVGKSKESADGQVLGVQVYCEHRHWNGFAQIRGGIFTRQGLDVLLAAVRQGRGRVCAAGCPGESESLPAEELGE